MRPHSMSMLGVFAIIDLLALFVFFSEPSTEPSALAVCEPSPAEIREPLLAEQTQLTAQHRDFLSELQERVAPSFGPSDDDPLPVPVNHDPTLENATERSPDAIRETNGTGGSEMLTTSVVGI